MMLAMQLLQLAKITSRDEVMLSIEEIKPVALSIVRVMFG